MESRVVGDSLVPLLRIVPIYGQHGLMISNHFDHVQYVPLLCKEFGTITIDIRDDTGRPEPFDGDPSFSTSQERTVPMNYNDYYPRQSGGALPYFVGARVQRGRGLGLFGGLIQSAMPLVKRGAVALGKRALKTDMRIVDDVMSGQSIKKAVKRRVTDAGKDC